MSMKLCKLLVNAILVGENKLFRDMLKDPELIADTILLPKFKLYRTTDDATLKLSLLTYSFAYHTQLRAVTY